MGRISTTVALPVLSLAGLSCALLPTVLLSTHTGGFGPVHRRDLSPDVAATIQHWMRLDLRFDAIYLGYVASAQQLSSLALALPGLMKEDARLYVDPVMGDMGRRYSYCGDDLIVAYRSLCARADLIFPNRTEAALLLDQALTEGQEPEPVSMEDLLGLGCKAAVLTGIRNNDQQIGVLGASVGFLPFQVMRRLHPGAYPGTGDLLASATIAALQNCHDLKEACNIACDFLDSSLLHTLAYGGLARYGLAFEKALPSLAGALLQHQEA